MDTDPAMLAKEIEEFIRNQENGQNVLDPEHTASQARPEQQRTPQPPAKTHVKVNYNGRHIELDVSNATPSEIKEGFGISSGNLELNRRGQNYKETNDDTFDPPLIAGTYNMTIIEVKAKKKEPTVPKQKKIKRVLTEDNNDNGVTFYFGHEKSFSTDLDEDGKVHFNAVHFKDKKNWRETILVNENDGKFEQIMPNEIDKEVDKGSKYTVLFYSDNKEHQQLKSLNDRSPFMLNKASAKSLSGISMTRAIVFWAAFPRIFFALSKINHEPEFKVDVSKYDFLICPRSLKASLYQIAFSINEFVRVQIFDVVCFRSQGIVKEGHYTRSLTYLLKIKSEVNDCINVLINYLRENEQNEATVNLVTELKGLEQQDKKVQDELDDYKNGKDVSELVKTKGTTIFSHDDKKVKEDFKELAAQRNILNSIFSSVKPMILQEEFDIAKVLYLLKLVKQLICAEISHFIRAEAIYKHEDDELDYIKKKYEKLFEMWRVVGAAISLIVDLDRNTGDWSPLKEEILNIQRVAEAGFYEMVGPFFSDSINE